MVATKKKGKIELFAIRKLLENCAGVISSIRRKHQRILQILI